MTCFCSSPEVADGSFVDSVEQVGGWVVKHVIYSFLITYDPWIFSESSSFLDADLSF